MLPHAFRRPPRGFTLIELLVAITAGVAVAAAAILLSKNAVRLFQEEARISYAQVAVSLGLTRLGTDIEAAGRNSTPNPTPKTNPSLIEGRDPRLCARPNLVDWPAGMRRLAPVIVERMNAVPQQSADNKLTPERITIAGDLDSGESFDLRTVMPGASGMTLILQPRGRPVRRIEALTADGNARNRLTEIFRAGRIARIEGDTHDYYGVIGGITITGSPTIQTIAVQLTPVPEVPSSPQSSLRCAIKGFGVGWPVHVISRVRWEVRSLHTDPQYQDYVKATNPVTGDEGRTELVRVELDASDNEMPGTLDLVTEYAVDLRFGLTVQKLPALPDNPVLEHFPIEDPGKPESAIYTIAAAPTESGSAPESVRAVQVRLSTRSRAPDRPTSIAGPAGRPYRFFVSSAKMADKYARMRTLQREFALYNVREGR
jgi:prepilin-type N-terminal cleavage/methylation domain-containing protein